MGLLDRFKGWRFPVRILVLVGVFAALVVVLEYVPWRQVDNFNQNLAPRDRLPALDKLRMTNEYRRTLAQIIGGLALLVGLFLTWRRIAAAERTVEIVQEEQITERFTRAIEQLGHEKREVRVGGIYALERIARDSERDHWTIMEVLTAYIRENAPLPSRVGGPARSERGPNEAGGLPPDNSEEIPTDVQAILTVIGRRNRDTEQEGQTLDSSRTNLRRARLGGAHLEWANFDEALLEGANLDKAHMEDASLRGAHLEGADFLGTHLRNANMKGTDLTAAKHLSQAQIEGDDAALIDRNTKLPPNLRPPAGLDDGVEERTDYNI